MRRGFAPSCSAMTRPYSPPASLNQAMREPSGDHAGCRSATPGVRDTVIVGSTINDQTIIREATPGFARAYDVRSGRHRWDFHTVPQSADEYGSDTWLNESWRYSGNTNIWSMMSGDEELGWVFLPIGTPTSDYYGGHRLGDNLFAESLVAVDVETGQRQWHFQMIHHGLWDWDLPAAPNLDQVCEGMHPPLDGSVLLRDGARRFCLGDVVFDQPVNDRFFAALAAFRHFVQRPARLFLEVPLSDHALGLQPRCSRVILLDLVGEIVEERLHVVPIEIDGLGLVGSECLRTQVGENLHGRVPNRDGTRLSTVAGKGVILDRTATTTCRGCMSGHRRQEPVWTSVRGAYVKAVSPAERGRSEATRLDVGEHTRTLLA